LDFLQNYFVIKNKYVTFALRKINNSNKEKA